MRLHTDLLTHEDVVESVAGLPGVKITATGHGSMTHVGAYEVRLEGNGRMGGQWGNSASKGASWDEWGTVLARLFTLDPEMRVGDNKRPTYRNREHFDYATGNRFTGEGLPSDTHVRHWWKPRGQWEQYCATCTAVRRVG